MTELCAGHKKKHSDSNWKFMNYKDMIGNERAGWFCSDFFTPTNYEFTSDNIRQERVKYWKSLVQPFRNNEPSKEYMEAYPDKAKKIFTQKQIREAKHTWKDLPGWSSRQKSK